MCSLNVVSNSILKHYEESVLNNLIKEALLDENPKGVKIFADGVLSMTMTEEIKSLSVNDTAPLHKNTLTDEFIRSCPLIQNDETEGTQGQKAPRINKRRMAVSERNEYDRYIFKVVLSKALVESAIDAQLL